MSSYFYPAFVPIILLRHRTACFNAFTLTPAEKVNSGKSLIDFTIYSQKFQVLFIALLLIFANSAFTAVILDYLGLNTASTVFSRRCLPFMLYIITAATVFGAKTAFAIKANMSLTFTTSKSQKI